MCDQRSSVSLCVQDYTSRRAAVISSATLVNTHRYTHRQLLTRWWAEPKCYYTACSGTDSSLSVSSQIYCQPNDWREIWVCEIYLRVFCKMLIANVLLLRYKRKKLQNLSHLNCGLHIHQIWIRLITACGKYCKRMHHAWLIWTNGNSNWERNGPSWIVRRHCSSHSSMGQVISDAIPSLAVFCTRCNQMRLNVVNLEVTDKVRCIDREFEFYAFFSFLKFNEFYDFFRLKTFGKNS